MMTKEEFEKSLLDPLGFWGALDQANVRALLGPETARMVGYNQNNPHHCYDLFMHTLHAVDNLPEGASDAIRIAAFFHDIGKPVVAMEKQGRTVFYGHAKKSAQIANKLLRKLGYGPYEIEKICFFIYHHDDFISWVLPSEAAERKNVQQSQISPKRLRIHIEKTMRYYESLKGENFQALWGQLLLLCRADAAAQAKLVYRDGILVDSAEHKQEKVLLLQKCLSALSFGV